MRFEGWNISLRVCFMERDKEKSMIVVCVVLNNGVKMEKCLNFWIVFFLGIEKFLGLVVIYSRLFVGWFICVK